MFKLMYLLPCAYGFFASNLILSFLLCLCMSDTLNQFKETSYLLHY